MPLIDPSDEELGHLRALANLAGQRVVEIGTGDGRLAWPLAPEAALWVALDPDAEEVGRAAGYLRELAQPLAHLVVADGRALCLPSGVFDIALFTWSLC